MRYTTYLIAMFLVLFVWSVNAKAEIMMSNSLAKDIGRAYGYYLGQDYALKEISKKYPSLSGMAFIAENEFAAIFESSIGGMDSIMLKYGKYVTVENLF